MRQVVFRAHDAERGPDGTGMVPDRSGDTTNALDVLLVVNGEAGRPDSGHLPVEFGAGNNGINGHLFEGGATDDAFEFWLGKPGCKGFAHGRTVNRSSGPDLLDDPYRAFGFPLGDDRHNPVPEDREACAFTRAMAQLIQKGHGNLGKLLLAPGASGKLKKLGGEGVGSSPVILNEVAEFNESLEEMMGGAPRQSSLPGDLREGHRATHRGNDFDNPKSPLERLVSLVQIHEIFCFIY